MSTLIPYEDKIKLINQLKKMKYMPPTGHGKIKVKIDIQKNDITMVTVKTKNRPENEQDRVESQYVKKDNN